MEPQLKALHEAATRGYALSGKFTWYSARGKLRHDPVYFSLLREGLLPDRGILLDVGCGKGVLLSLLASASERYRDGAWPPGWPAPPSSLELRGIDSHGGRVRIARRALADRARVDVSAVRDFDFPRCAAIAMLDVLMYLEPAEQRRALEKAAAALEPGGLLLLRETDAGAGLTFEVSRLAERLVGALRGEFALRLYYRDARDWTSDLRNLGLAVAAISMSRGTPFANVLFVARKAPVGTLSVVKSEL